MGIGLGAGAIQAVIGVARGVGGGVGPRHRHAGGPAVGRISLLEERIGLDGGVVADDGAVQ